MPSPPFIGRLAELAQLEDDAGAAPGRLILVAGEPGIGKTRLCAELLLRRPELRAAWGRCMAGDITPPYWPFIQVFRELALERPPPEPLAGLLALSAPAGGGDVSGQFALFDAAARWLSGFHQRRALVLDDLQWADQSSLRMLEFLAVQLANLPLLVIGTFREDEVREEPVREATLLRVARAGSLIRLGGLSDQESARLIRQLAPMASDARVRALTRATAGNPFFVGELASMPEGATLPTGARHALGVRLARLDRSAAALLGVAAVLGHEFELGTLEAVGGLGPVAGPVEALVLAGWLRTLDRAPPRCAFVHDLAREAALDALGAAERARLHLRAAEVLEGGSAAPALIAFHRLSALPLGDVDLAIRASVEAARRELDGWAFDEAIAHLERAIRAAGDRSLLERAELRVQLGRALIRSGDAGRGREVCLAAAEDAQAAGSARAVCEAALTLGEASTFGAVDGPLVEILNRGLTLPEAEDPGLRARLLGRLAAALMPAPDPAVPSRMAQEAIALARSSGDPAALLTTLVAARGALTNLDPIELVRGIDQEALQLARAAGDRRAEMQTRQRLLQDHIATWDMGRLRAELAEFEHGLSAHDLLNRVQAHLLRFTLETTAGAFAVAEAQLAEVQALHARMRDPASLRLTVRPVQFARLALLRLRGSPEDLDELGALRVEGFAAEPYGLLRELMADDLTAARARLDRLVRSGFVERFPYISFASLPEAVWQLEHREGAEALRAVGARAQVRGYLFPTAGVCAGAAERMEALIAAVRGEAELADALFARALAQNAGAGCAALAAITRFQWAISLRRLGTGGDRADELLAASQRAFAELGMPWWAARAAASRPATAPLPTPSPRARLSMRLEEGAWRLEYGGERLCCADSHGLRYLDLLVARPGVALGVRELYEALHGEGAAGPAGDAGRHLDERAIRAYRARLEELSEAMQASRSRGALERHERQQAEFDAIVAELRRATGLGGRPRVAGARDERLRINLTQRIRSAIRKVAEQSPTLAHHLDTCVQTGATCVYVPPPGDDVTRAE